MKRLLVLFAIIGMLFASSLRAEEILIGDWLWNGTIWVYTGSDPDPGDPPPPPPRGNM